ncbi:LysR family transcriptional regulator [Roseburia hominis]
MTLNQLEYFQTVAHLQHYRQAAEKLMISQPSLSRSIAALEEELNLVLFEKKGRNVELTRPGHMFLAHVDRIMDEVHTAQYKMKQLAGSGGHIDIAYVFPLASYYIPHTVRSFLDMDKNQNVTFNFNQTHTADMVAGLKADKHDIIFCSYVENEPEIEFIPILHQEMVIITPKGHPLTTKETVSFRDLADYPVIGYDKFSGLGGLTNQFYQKNHLKVEFVCECPDENSIAALVAENFGIAFVAHVDAIDPDKVAILPISDVTSRHTVYMGYLRDKYRIPATTRFIQFVKNMGKEQIS